VTVVTKDRVPEGSSNYAQGGIASVWSRTTPSQRTQPTPAAGQASVIPRSCAWWYARDGRVRDMIALARASLRPDAKAFTSTSASGAP
jgi:aspartate oxidase